MAKLRRSNQKKIPALVPAKASSAAPVSRFSRIRKSVSSVFSTPKRKVTAISLAAALVAGSFGVHKAMDTHRVNHWRNNASIHFVYAPHETFQDLTLLERELQQAHRQKKDFKILAVESGNTTTTNYRQSEWALNESVRQLRNLLPAQQWETLSSEEIVRRLPPPQDKTVTGAEVRRLILAAKYNLRIKVAEKYANPAEVDRIRSLTFDAIKQLDQNSKQALLLPIPELIQQAKKSTSQFDLAIRLRDENMAKTLDELTVESRREDPSLRKENLRILVSAGSMHARADNVLMTSRVAPRRTIQQSHHGVEREFGFRINLAAMFAAEANPRPLVERVHTLTLASIVDPYARANERQLNLFMQRFKELDEREAKNILSQLNDVTGLARAKKAVQLVMK